MRRISYAQGAFWGAFTSLGVVSVSYLAHDLFRLPYIAGDLFEFVTQALPGQVVPRMVELMVRLITTLRLGPTAQTAKSAESAMAVLGFIVIGAVFGLVLSAFWDGGYHRLKVYGVAGGVIMTAVSMMIDDALDFNGLAPLPTLACLLLLYIGWGLVLQRLIFDRVVPQEPPTPTSQLSPEGTASLPEGPAAPSAAHMTRRQFALLVVAGVLTAVFSALRIQAQRSQDAPVSGSPAGGSPSGGGSTEGSSTSITPTAPALVADASDTSGPAQSPPASELQARFPPVHGTRPELTPPADFYRVDINLEPPVVNGASWKLTVDGLVDHPLALTQDDLRSLPSTSQAITLECISNPVGGDLISSAVWQGVRLKDVLQKAGLQRDAKFISIESADTFFESVGLEDVQDDRVLLVYAMDGAPLTRDHGFPLRLYLPGRHGMKMPKWITHLKAVTDDLPGYWVERGWSESAVVNTTSVIDIVAVSAKDPKTGFIPIGGIAYSGERGISKVEVRVDDFAWEPAELRAPPLSPLTWTQWRYFWLPSPGRHTIMVRATDGAGELQRVAESDTFPDGATGYHQVSVTI